MTIYKTVALSPPADGGTLDFDGERANERILLRRPNEVGFDSAELNLGGGNDLIPTSRRAISEATDLSGVRAMTTSR